MLTPIKFGAFLIKLNETPETDQKEILNNILIHKEAFANIQDNLIDYSSYLKVPMISQTYYKSTMKYYNSIYQNLIYLRGIFKDMEKLDFSMYNIRELIDTLHNNDLYKIDFVNKLAHKSEPSKIYMMKSEFEVPNNPEEIYSLFLFNMNLTIEQYQEIKCRFTQLKDLYIYNDKIRMKTKMPNLEEKKEHRFIPLETLTLENELNCQDKERSGVIKFIRLIPYIGKLTLKNIFAKKPILFFLGFGSIFIKSLEIINCDYKINYLNIPSLEYIKIMQDDCSTNLTLSISESMREITIDELSKIKEVNLIPTHPGNILPDLHIKHINNDMFKTIQITHNPYIENFFISDSKHIWILGYFKTNKLKITRCGNLKIFDVLTINTLDIDYYPLDPSISEPQKPLGDHPTKLFELCEKCTNIIYLKNINISGFKITEAEMTTYFSNCKRIVTYRKNVADDILWQLNTPKYEKISILREL